MMDRDWLDAKRLYEWLHERGLTGEYVDNANVGRSLRRWKKGGSTSVYTADRVLTALDVRLTEIPDEIWIEKPARRSRRSKAEEVAVRAEGMRMLAEGYWASEVSKLLGVSRRAVGRWKARLGDDR